MNVEFYENKDTIMSVFRKNEIIVNVGLLIDGTHGKWITSVFTPFEIEKMIKTNKYRKMNWVWDKPLVTQ